MKTITKIINKYKDTKFIWGELDCCIFSISILEEYNNVVFPLWRDVLDYKNHNEALLALKKLGCNTLEDLPSIILGTPRKEIIDVKHGDAVYYINEDGIGIFGICNGIRAYFLQKNGGLTARSIFDCKYAWSAK